MGMNRCNLMVLSAGRRVELVRFVRETFERQGIKCKIVTCDMSKWAPAHCFADIAESVPAALDATYSDEVIRLARHHDIDVIIPTIDTELLPLALRRDDIMRVSLINLSSLSTVRICRDKRETARVLKLAGLKSPVEYESADKAVFPAFIKPEDGSASRDARRVNTPEELAFHIKRISRPLVQEHLEGDEYSVDIFCDFDGEPITIVPRKRIEVRGGEIQKGFIIKHETVMNASVLAARALGLTGHNTLQCIVNEQGVYFIEVNARFGGGAPMSMRAGANSILNLYRIRCGERLKYNEDYMDRIYCLRFDDSVYYSETGERVNI